MSSPSSASDVAQTTLSEPSRKRSRIPLRFMLGDLAGERHGLGTGSGDQPREPLAVIDAPGQHEHAAASSGFTRNQIDDEAVAIGVARQVTDDGSVGLSRSSKARVARDNVILAQFSFTPRWTISRSISRFRSSSSRSWSRRVDTSLFSSATGSSHSFSDSLMSDRCCSPRAIESKTGAKTESASRQRLHLTQPTTSCTFGHEPCPGRHVLLDMTPTATRTATRDARSESAPVRR